MTSFPGLCLAWERLEDLVYMVTGWHTRFSHAMRKFDSVSSSSRSRYVPGVNGGQWSSAALKSNISQEKQTSAMPNFIRVMVRSGLAPQSALSEAKEMLGPGTDTTSASLAHILWALAHNPQYQDDLFNDLSKHGFPEHMSNLESIPKLKACVKEGIRWAGAAAAMLPRVVPKDGVELCGKFIPGGVWRRPLHFPLAPVDRMLTGCRRSSALPRSGTCGTKPRSPTPKNTIRTGG